MKATTTIPRKYRVPQELVIEHTTDEQATAVAQAVSESIGRPTSTVTLEGGYSLVRCVVGERTFLSMMWPTGQERDWEQVVYQLSKHAREEYREPEMERDFETRRVLEPFPTPGRLKQELGLPMNGKIRRGRR